MNWLSKPKKREKHKKTDFLIIGVAAPTDIASEAPRLTNTPIKKKEIKPLLPFFLYEEYFHFFLSPKKWLIFAFRSMFGSANLVAVNRLFQIIFQFW